MKLKLRFYLRGLAVGILLTTLILTISGKDKTQMSDAQIRSRALELGMVDGSSVTLSTIAKTAEPESTPESENESMPQTPEGSTVSETGSVPESSESGTGQETEAGSVPESSENGTRQETEAGSVPESSESSTVPETESVPESSEGSTGQVPVVFVIKSGSSSDTVSRNLAAAGLVEDSAAFDAYLCKNGYAQKIRVGTYEILPGTPEEEIARMIAK